MRATEEGTALAALAPRVHIISLLDHAGTARMEWVEPGIVLNVRPYGENDAIATVITEAYGTYRGLARGGASRRLAATWQLGNLAEVRWVARLADQLGSFSAELIYPAAALAMDNPLSLAILSAACAVAEGALPEREPHPHVFATLLAVMLRLSNHEQALTDFIRWELLLLSELGYGLDLTACAVTGKSDELDWVSPRTGRAISDTAAGAWRARLLRLPAFLMGAADAAPIDWCDGLRLTGHFLTRDAFGGRHQPLPVARQMLYDQVRALVHSGE